MVKSKQRGGDFNVLGDDLDKIHNYLLTLNADTQLELVKSYKRFLLIIHPDRGGNTEMFQIIGSPELEGTFLYYLKIIETDNPQQVFELIGHNNFTLGDIIQLSDKNNPKYESFKNLLKENISESQTETEDSVIDFTIIGLDYLNFTNINLNSKSIDLDAYISLLKIFKYFLIDVGDNSINDSEKELCTFLGVSIDERLNTMEEYNNYMLANVQGGGDDDNPCPKIFGPDEWKSWYNKNKEKNYGSDNNFTQLYDSLKNSDNDYARGRLSASSEEINEIVNKIERQYPNIDVNKVTKHLSEANKLFAGAKQSKINSFYSLGFLVVAGIMQSGFSGNFSEMTSIYFLALNTFLMCYTFLNIDYYNKFCGKQKNTSVHQILNFNSYTLFIFVFILLMFSGLFFLYGTQETLVSLFYESSMNSEAKNQQLRDTYNLAVVAESLLPKNEQVMPIYANLQLAMQSLKESPNFTKEKLVHLISILKDEVSLASKGFLQYHLEGITGESDKERILDTFLGYGGLKNKTRKNKKTHKNKKLYKNKKTHKKKIYKKTRKNKKMRKNKIGGVFGLNTLTRTTESAVKGAEILSTGAQATGEVISKGAQTSAEILGAHIQQSSNKIAAVMGSTFEEFFSLLSQKKMTDVPTLVKILQFPQKVLNTANRFGLADQGAPEIIKTSASTILNNPTVNWIASVLNESAKFVYSKPKEFRFGDADTSFKVISSLASYAYMSGRTASSGNTTIILLYTSAALLFLPELVPLISTKLNLDLNSLLPKSVEQAVAENGDLDCLRQYLLFKFYNSLNTITTKTIGKDNYYQPDNYPSNNNTPGAFRVDNDGFPSGFPPVITPGIIAQPVQGITLQGNTPQGDLFQADAVQGKIQTFYILKVFDANNNEIYSGTFTNLSSNNRNINTIKKYLKDKYSYSTKNNINSGQIIDLGDGYKAMITKE